MEYQNLLVEQDNGILILTMNRPKALNALNNTTIDELDHFFRQGYKNYKNVSGIIITGAGEKSFVAGADIKGFGGLSAHQGIELSKHGQDVFFLIERFHVPIIAAVNGFALGGGCELAMACHLRVASDNARFGQPEVNLGLIPGYGGTQRLIQLIGKGKALELMMTGDMLNADAALSLGLVNYVVPQGEEVLKAKKLISKIATKGPIAISKVIESVNDYFDKTKDGFSEESNNFGVTIQTHDASEGIAAFVEKRNANFSGN